MWYIYTIRNKETGKLYVGCRKFKGDPETDVKYNGSGKLLRQDIKQLGLDRFEKKIVLSNIDDEDEAYAAEIRFIKELDTLTPKGYNITYGGRYGRGSTRGFEFSEESRKKQSDAAKALWSDPEFKAAQIEKMRAGVTEESLRSMAAKNSHPLSEETKEKIRLANTGKKRGKYNVVKKTRTEEQRRNISEGRKRLFEQRRKEKEEKEQ